VVQVTDIFKKASFQAKNILINRTALKQYKLLKNQQFADPEELAEISWLKCRSMVEFAYNNVSFYRDFYDKAGFNPADLRMPDDFNSVPVLQKEHIREFFDEMIADGVSSNDYTVSTTGGSTGQPLKVLFDKRVPLDAFGWRVLNWWQLNGWNDIAFIFRLRREGLRALLNDVLWWPTKRSFLDASSMTEESISQFVSKLQKTKPAIIQGYVGAVVEVANYIEKKGISFDFVKAVWVTSSPIFSTQRKLLESVFNAPVYDQYGCGEVFWIAAECEKHEGLHILSDLRHLEFLDENSKAVSNDEFGDIVITDLENRVFPIIRYKNGDRGKLLTKNCSCGMNLPLMAPIKGRISDSLRFPDGRVLSGDYLTTLFDDFPNAVKAFQIKQNKDYSLTLICVGGTSDKSTKDINSVIQLLKEKTANGIEIRLQMLDEIKHELGKTRFIISEVEK
jgi:phenylacetate-CoA ligase